MCGSEPFKLGSEPFQLPEPLELLEPFELPSDMISDSSSLCSKLSSGRARFKLLLMCMPLPASWMFNAGCLILLKRGSILRENSQASSIIDSWLS